MTPKTLIYIGAVVGGAIGGYIPVLFFGVSEISMSAIFWGLVGGLLGIWGAFKLSRSI